MAVNAGLALLPSGRPAKLATPQPEPAREPAPAERVLRRNATIVVDEPVRAGQQIYAEGGDLIALAPVSPGGEVLADGNIHVYSHLRGRAHAGVDGDQSARIFCHSLEAQLVSIDPTTPSAKRTKSWAESSLSRNPSRCRLSIAATSTGWLPSRCSNR